MSQEKLVFLSLFSCSTLISCKDALVFTGRVILIQNIKHSSYQKISSVQSYAHDAEGDFNLFVVHYFRRKRKLLIAVHHYWRKPDCAINCDFKKKLREAEIITTLCSLEYFCRIRRKTWNDEHDWSKSARDLRPTSSGRKQSTTTKEQSARKLQCWLTAFNL